MKKLFASMIVLGALVAMGCAEKDTAPPADETAPPAEQPADETPMEEPAAP